MSGRIAAVDAVHEGDRLTVYVGVGQRRRLEVRQRRHDLQAGLRQQPVQSIGAIAIDPKNPKVVWVGTGESWTRNSVSIGDGIYKSTDGGENWTNIGLNDSERIAKILVDPRDGNTVYACAPGQALERQRRARRLQDDRRRQDLDARCSTGANASTGCSMMSMDPQEPEDALRRHVGLPPPGMDVPLGRRWPDGRAAADSSNHRRRRALDASSTTRPPRVCRRSRGDASPSLSRRRSRNVVYAFIEAVPPKNALYRSDDGGRLASARPQPEHGLASVLFRQSHRRSQGREQASTSRTARSDRLAPTAAASFSNIGGGAHGDFHDVWIDPANTDHLITGDDGGLWYSYDGGNRGGRPTTCRSRSSTT